MHLVGFIIRTQTKNEDLRVYVVVGLKSPITDNLGIRHPVVFEVHLLTYSMVQSPS